MSSRCSRGPSADKQLLLQCLRLRQTSSGKTALPKQFLSITMRFGDERLCILKSDMQATSRLASYIDLDLIATPKLCLS